MEILLLIAALVVLAGGIGVLFLNRRSDDAPGIDPPVDGGGVLAPERPAPAEPTVEAPAVEAPAAPVVVEPEPAVVEPAVVEPAVVEPEPVVEPPKRPSFRDRLTKARSTFSGYLGSLLSRSDITEETWEELEEALIRADVGVGLTTTLLDGLRDRVKADGITEPAVLIEALKADLKARLGEGDRSLRLDEGRTNVWLFVGVNGVGKTTSIGKVGKAQIADGRTVTMAAGDTFRAAAAEQLQTWADRAGADYHRGEEGGDPSSVIFDAIAKAAARGHDLVLADTAGRLHTKSNLMDELSKVRRVADRDPGHVTEVLLVLDATTGQNGLQQAKQFSEATQCTGVVLTKLDGSAKGGIALAIAVDPSLGGLGLPIKLVGLGESADDLIEFDPDAFVDALFET